jgi:hypothetical protein
VVVLEGKAEMASLVWSPPLRIAFSADVQSPQASFALRQCYTPLWQASDETGRNIPLVPAEKTGLVTFTLPQGKHSASITFSLPPMEKWAGWASLLSLLAAGAVAWKGRLTEAGRMA